MRKGSFSVEKDFILSQKHTQGPNNKKHHVIIAIYTLSGISKHVCDDIMDSPRMFISQK